MPDRMLDGFALDQFDVLDIDPRYGCWFALWGAGASLGMYHV